MTTEPPSSKRRHILSSINPEERQCLSPRPDGTASPSEATLPSEYPPPEATGEPPTHPDPADHKPSRFRFKSRESRRSLRSSRHRERDYVDEDEEDRHHDSSSSHRRRRKHRHHHRHKRRRSRTRSPTPPNPYDPPPLDPEAAFRESLFDAMADDEGASYWEGVYGQPIHVYSNAKPGPKGELEQMDDDQYAAYVRQKMWEKTHQGLLEERARKEEQKKQTESKEQEARRLTKEMEESLRRGEERRKRKSWKIKFEDYAKAWAGWTGDLEGMSWPVASGRREGISSDTVRDFFVSGLDPIEIGEKDFLAKLKDERVRWHPDKIQQKLGTKFDESVSRDVTAVFQIVDKLWADSRGKA
ncbi:hypothetical protein BJ170DRAFT_349788 [Xylariales sp. AK1849]|nr:hypothetical protein BJ170DRAFT_349788 [Xylariales sp. AK1849]